MQRSYLSIILSNYHIITAESLRKSFTNANSFEGPIWPEEESEESDLNLANRLHTEILDGLKNVFEYTSFILIYYTMLFKNDSIKIKNN